MSSSIMAQHTYFSSRVFIWPSSLNSLQFLTTFSSFFSYHSVQWVSSWHVNITLLVVKHGFLTPGKKKKRILKRYLTFKKKGHSKPLGHYSFCSAFLFTYIWFLPLSSFKYLNKEFYKCVVILTVFILIS